MSDSNTPETTSYAPDLYYSFQVHFLVRENLLAIDELREEQDSIYKELHECFGLEKCRKEENDQTVLTGPPPRKLWQYELRSFQMGGSKLEKNCL